MPLKVLCAGCSTDERERAESDVRRALGPRVRTESWTVSLVKLQNRWSVSLDGPQAHGISCLAPPDRLSESIIEALSLPSSTDTDLPPDPAAPGAQRETHRCAKCSQGFVLTFDAMAGEAQETAPVACPHCWHINQVAVSNSAAATGDYRATKA